MRRWSPAGPPLQPPWPRGSVQFHAEGPLRAETPQRGTPLRMRRLSLRRRDSLLRLFQREGIQPVGVGRDGGPHPVRAHDRAQAGQVLPEGLRVAQPHVKEPVLLLGRAGRGGGKPRSADPGGRAHALQVRGQHPHPPVDVRPRLRQPEFPPAVGLVLHEQREGEPLGDKSGPAQFERDPLGKASQPEKQRLRRLDRRLVVPLRRECLRRLDRPQDADRLAGSPLPKRHPFGAKPRADSGLGQCGQFPAGEKPPAGEDLRLRRRGRRRGDGKCRKKGALVLEERQRRLRFHRLIGPRAAPARMLRRMGCQQRRAAESDRHAQPGHRKLRHDGLRTGPRPRRIRALQIRGAHTRPCRLDARREAEGGGDQQALRLHLPGRIARANDDARAARERQGGRDALLHAERFRGDLRHHRLSALPADKRDRAAGQRRIAPAQRLQGEIPRPDHGITHRPGCHPARCSPSSRRRGARARHGSSASRISTLVRRAADRGSPSSSTSRAGMAGASGNCVCTRTAAPPASAAR